MRAFDLCCVTAPFRHMRRAISIAWRSAEQVSQDRDGMGGFKSEAQHP